jgi:hypothetical protein
VTGGRHGVASEAGTDGAPVSDRAIACRPRTTMTTVSATRPAPVSNTHAMSPPLSARRAVGQQRAVGNAVPAACRGRAPIVAGSVDALLTCAGRVTDSRGAPCGVRRVVTGTGGADDG